MIKKILVIDDDEGILEAFRAMLESEGYEVITSSHASYIKTLSAHQLPDLILLDVLLSGEDGREVCKMLKSKKETNHIPILMMSAAPNMEKTVKDACADGYLKKPFEIEEVLQTIRTYA